MITSEYIDNNYLVIIMQSEIDEFICTGCTTMDEVYQVITDYIKDNINYLRGGDGGFMDPFDESEYGDNITEFLDYIMSQSVITNPGIYDGFFRRFSDISAQCSYMVIDKYGEVIFQFSE